VSNAATPRHDSYDVVIVGGAMLGSSIAWWLSQSADFQGRILVVERDPSYQFSSTAHTNSCIRQQFSTEINIRISQFGAQFIREFRAFMGNGPDVPLITFQTNGYMYLADNQNFAQKLRKNCETQNRLGAGTRILSPDEILSRYPFYNLDGIILGSHNDRDEGYFDGNTIFDWWRRMAIRNGVEYIANEVVALERKGAMITSATLKTGEIVALGTVVNASGPRASRTAAMAGLDLPVEPRKRYTYIFDAAQPLDRDLPLTIDPCGVHMRSEGRLYLAGSPPKGADPGVEPDDFVMDHTQWEDHVWPALANRVPAFEAVKLVNTWVGHYAYNRVDQNAIVGPHPEVANFIFANGFSGHGFQQSPAVGRGVAEWIAAGEFRSLDLSPLGYGRLVSGQGLREEAVI